jgi:hypothetical protein
MSRPSSNSLDLANAVLAVLATWERHDREHALGDADRRAIEDMTALRALVLEWLHEPRATRDGYSACARLGRILADAHASPTLASGTLDRAAHALAEHDFLVNADRIAGARAAVMEGYVARILEKGHDEIRKSWEAPLCVVPLEHGRVAIACGHPDEDEEALSGWAERVASSLRKTGARRAFLAGHPRAVEEVARALELVGINTVTADSARPPTSWLGRVLSSWRTSRRAAARRLS